MHMRMQMRGYTQEQRTHAEEERRITDEWI